MVIWLIGLSGSGKTTLAKEVLKLVKFKRNDVVLLDGDQVRNLFQNDLGHDMKDRFLNAKRIYDLCLFLDKQKIHVVCPVLSIFPESREWCRKNLSNYYEVFIDTPLSILKSRDSKGLYSKYERKEIKNVAGLDLYFPKPSSPDLIIKNDSELTNLLSYAKKLSNLILKTEGIEN